MKSPNIRFAFIVCLWMADNLLKMSIHKMEFV